MLVSLESLSSEIIEVQLDDGGERVVRLKVMTEE
jgi:hypothetical protein